MITTSEGKLKALRARQLALGIKDHTTTRDQRESYSVKLSTSGANKPHSMLLDFIITKQKCPKINRRTLIKSLKYLCTNWSLSFQRNFDNFQGHHPVHMTHCFLTVRPAQVSKGWLGFTGNPSLMYNQLGNRHSSLNMTAITFSMWHHHPQAPFILWLSFPL